MDKLSRELRALEREDDHAGLIGRVRDAVAGDRAAAMSHREVKRWCGKRWRNLFIGEASKDEPALKEASKGLLDRRRKRQRIAEEYLRGDGRTEWDVEMPEARVPQLKHTTLVFCPGLLNGLLPVRAFEEEFPEIEAEYGWGILRADLHPLAGCEANARDLERAIEEGIGLAAGGEPMAADEAEVPKEVFLMGYSKGMADLVTTLVKRPDLRSRVRCVFGWAGAAGGSYLADEAYDLIKGMDEDSERLAKLVDWMTPLASVPEIISRRAGETDIKAAVLNLTTEYRRAFLREHDLELNDLGIPFFNLTASTRRDEVPYFQVEGVELLDDYDSNNDMQVTQDQARLQIPMATDLAMLRGHHWDVSYGAFPTGLRMGSRNLDHPFPKKAAVVANFLLAAELGLID